MSDETLIRCLRVDWALARQQRRLDMAAEWLLVREAQIDRRQKCGGSSDAALRAEQASWRAHAWSMLAQAHLEAGRGDAGQKRLALLAVKHARQMSRAIGYTLWGFP